MTEVISVDSTSNGTKIKINNCVITDESIDGYRVSFTQSEGHNCLIVSYKDGINYASAELSDDYSGPKVLFFNRLFVNARIRRRGIATKLVEKAVEVIDRNGFSVVNCVNAYGDMSEKALIKFYEKFGFVQMEDGTLLRTPKN